MANKYLQNYPIPQDFAQILSDFTREILRDQPEDIIEYSAQYFEALQTGKKFIYDSKFNVLNPNPKSHYVAQPRESEPKQQQTPQIIVNEQEARDEKSFHSTSTHKEEKLVSKEYLADLEEGVLNDKKDASQAEEKKTEEEEAIEELGQLPEMKDLGHQISKFEDGQPKEDGIHKYVTIANGERLAYREAGEQNPKHLILLHGLLESSEIWVPIMDHLAKSYHVLAVDLRGCGRTTYRSKVHHMRDLADDIVQFMEALDIDSASFVGHFLGAGVVMTLAFRYTYKTEKLILLETISIQGFLYPGLDHREYRADEFESLSVVAPIFNAIRDQDLNFVKDLLVSEYFSGKAPSPDRLVQLTKTAFRCRSYIDLLFVMMRYNISTECNGIIDGNNGISLIENDILMICGLGDKISSLDNCKMIQGELGPKAELITIEDGCHAIVETHPEQIANNILEFLEKLPSFHKYLNLPNNETIAYMESGIYCEKVLLCLHSNLASSQNWDILFPKLDGDYHIIAIDLRGFGRSSYNTKIQDLTDFAKDVEAYLEARQLDKVTLIGDFLGAAVALLVSIRKPELVEKLILLNPIAAQGVIHKIEGVSQPQPEDFLKDETISGINAALTAKNTKFFEDKVPEKIKGNQDEEERYSKYIEDLFLCRAYLDALYTMSRFNISDQSNGIVDGTGEIHKIAKVPTLILHAEEDKMVSVEDSTHLTKELGDQAKLEVVTGAGQSFLESHVDHAADSIIKFLTH